MELDPAIQKAFGAMRSWDQDFLRLTAFAVPSPQEVKQRLDANLQYFAVNYALVVFLIFLFALVLKPMLLVQLIVMSAGGVWLGTRPDSFVLLVGGQALSAKQCLTIYASIGGIIMVVTVGHVLFLSVGICVITVLGHALFHRAKSISKAEEAAEVPENVI
jgi:hypothetical protein